MSLEAQKTAPAAGEVAGEPAATERDVQRGALGELVALVRQCGETYRRARMQFHDQQAAADRQLVLAVRQIEQQHQAACEQAEAQDQQKREEIEKRRAERLQKLEEAYQNTRRRIGHEYESVAGEVKQKLDQATWLAESVFEGVQTQVREDARKIKDEVEAQLEEVGRMEGQADALTARYGAARPQVPAMDREKSAVEDPRERFEADRERLRGNLARLSALGLPKLFVGIWPVALLVLLAIAAGGIAHWLGGQPQPQPKPIGVAVGGTLAGALLVGWLLRMLGHRQVRAVFVPLAQSVEACRRSAAQWLAHEKRQQQGRYDRAEQRCAAEIQKARDSYSPLVAKAKAKRDAALSAAAQEHDQQLSALQAEWERATADAAAQQQQAAARLRTRYTTDQSAIQRRHEEQAGRLREEFDQAQAELLRRWDEGLERIQTPIAKGAAHAEQFRPWEDPAWQNWTPPGEFPASVPFGKLKVDARQLVERSKEEESDLPLALPETFAVPALLAFPRQASLLIQTDRAGRADAIAALQMVMVRLLTSLPPGRVRFTIVDPVGLGQSFAAFMHLADYDEALVGGRIWTEAEHIEQRLADLTEHMETVIQKYLRNEFETIDQYNAQAGELAEPYRFLVIADFPNGFEADALRRLSSIATSGFRCGVYTLIARDLRVAANQNTHLEDVAAHSINILRQNNQWAWNDEVFRQFPLTLDPPPQERLLTRLLHQVGAAARDSKRVQVPFGSIAPAEGQLWSADNTAELRVPIGRIGANRLQTLRLGRGVAQHALIAGKTGSGKSTLLHALITNLALWYSPQQVELYLVDFKKGVEFKTYAAHRLPHARAIAVESDREFGLSVLHRLDAELTRRGELFRGAGVQDLAAYRQAANEPLPRTLLIVDEFQEFFSEDDRLSQDAAVLLDRLVRQGRAFGIHVLLGSQTIGGASGLSRSTIGQMAVRIALQCSEADSQLILGDNNSAARLLSRPGESIYNDAGGLVEANSPYQIAWLPDEQREDYLQRIRDHADAAAGGNGSAVPPIVFEGNAPADLRANRRLAALLQSPRWPEPTAAPVAWVGEPVAIKDPTGLVLRRQSGANLLIVGQQEEPATAMVLSAMLSLAAQHAPGRAMFYLLDGTPADSPLAGALPRLGSIFPHPLQVVEYRAASRAMEELYQQLQQRLAGDDRSAPNLYLVVFGLQRYRDLRKSGDEFSFSVEAEKTTPPDKQFAELLRDGPAVGVHTLAWCDTPATVERTLDRGALRQFDYRILFQMSAADSSNLIDSPLANKLGPRRALAYSEEQGTIEKFRPYALPPADWRDWAAARFRQRGNDS